MANNQNIEIVVTPEVLLSQATQVSMSLDKMKRSFSETESILNGTIGYWNGEAADYQRRAFREFSPKVDEMLTRIRERVDTLKQIAQIYVGVEASVIATTEPLPSDILK